MAFVSDIVSGAYRRLGLFPVGTTLDTARQTEGLATFNGLVDELLSDGIAPNTTPSAPQAYQMPVNINTFLPYGPNDAKSPPTNMTASGFQWSDTFPYLPQFSESFKDFLAVRLAANSGITALPEVQRAARKLHDNMLAFAVIAPVADTDQTLQWMPSLRRYAFR